MTKVPDITASIDDFLGFGDGSLAVVTEAANNTKQLLFVRDGASVQVLEAPRDQFGELAADGDTSAHVEIAGKAQYLDATRCTTSTCEPTSTAPASRPRSLRTGDRGSEHVVIGKESYDILTHTSSLGMTSVQWELAARNLHGTELWRRDMPGALLGVAFVRLWAGAHQLWIAKGDTVSAIANR